MAKELFNNGSHVCIVFNDLADKSSSEAVQSNQFLIVTDGHGALIDPGGNMTYNALMVGMAKYFNFRKLHIFLPHIRIRILNLSCRSMGDHLLAKQW